MIKPLLCLILSSFVTLAQPHLAVTIAPQLESVRAIAGQDAVIEILVPPGASPETYSPTAREMKSLSRTQLLFTIGAPIETALLPKIRGAFPNVQIIDATQGMAFREIAEEHDHSHTHHHSGHDPHVWLSISNMKLHASNVLNALCALIPENQEIYQANYQHYLQSLDKLDQELSALLLPKAGSAILVFHPAFGYLLDSYNIRQVSVEADGKQPSPKHLAHLIKLVKTQSITLLYIQPQTNDGDAKALAKSLGLALRTLDPLPTEYSSGLRKLANAIANPAHD